MLGSTAGSGHLGPLLELVDSVESSEVECCVVVADPAATTLAAAGRQVVVADPPAPDQAAEIWRRFEGAGRAEATRLVDGELFARLTTAAMLPAVERAVQSFRPDLVLREPCAYAPAVVARRHGLAHAQVAITWSAGERSVLSLVAPLLDEVEPGLAAALAAAPYLTRFPASLDPDTFERTERYRVATVSDPAPLPSWWGGDDRPLVYATLGTVAPGLGVGRAARAAVLDAVAGLEARVLLTTGREGADDLGELPSNVHVEPFVSHAEVMAAAAVVCCHGGSGTTLGALAAGCPLVFVPLFADQPTTARIVAGAGAGVVAVEPPEQSDPAAFGGPDAARDIRRALEEVLGDERYAARARALGAEMAAQPDLTGVLDRLARTAR